MDSKAFTSWLLGARTPSIQYQTRLDLLGLPPDDPGAMQARQTLMHSGPVPAILSRQAEDGSWQGERSYYTPKYISTHWSMLLLTELSVDGRQARFQRGVEHMLAATAPELNRQLDQGEYGFSCFWGNLLRYALHAGLAGDARVEKLIRLAEAGLQEGPCRCDKNWDFACAWGVVRSLWGLAAIPKAQRSPRTEAAIAQGVKFLLETSRLIAASYPSPENIRVNPLWFKLNFPLFYQVDILFTLRVLDELGMLDHPGAREALDWLERLSSKSGRWPGISPFRQRTWRELGDREETSRWVSLQAARILQHAGRNP
jgi:hypothetical protein